MKIDYIQHAECEGCPYEEAELVKEEIYSRLSLNLQSTNFNSEASKGIEKSSLLHCNVKYISQKLAIKFLPQTMLSSLAEAIISSSTIILYAKSHLKHFFRLPKST